MMGAVFFGCLHLDVLDADITTASAAALFAIVTLFLEADNL